MIENLEARVIEGEERLRQAMLHHDTRVLDDIIAPELMFTGHVGQRVTKADDIAFHEAAVLNLSLAEMVERQIQVHDDFAVVSVLMHLVGVFDGTPIDQHMRYTRVWAISSNGTLQVVAGHMSELRPM